MSDAQERVTCPGCSKGYRWKSSLIGRKVPCKNCGSEFEVPAAPGVGLLIQPAINDDGYELDLDEQSENPAASYAAPSNNGKCPACNSPVRDGAVLCMNCGFNMAEGKKIDAPQVEALPEADKKAMRRELSGMKWVRIGLWLNMASIVVMFAIFPTTFLAFMYDSDLMYLLVDIGAYAYLALGTIGSLLCLTAPKECKGRPVLLISMALSISTSIWMLLINFANFSDNHYWLIELISDLATILFLYFFVLLAQYLEFDQITERAQKVLGCYIIIVLSAYLLYLPLIGCITLILMLALAIYTLFLYIALLIDLNNALTHHIQEQSV